MRVAPGTFFAGEIELVDIGLDDDRETGHGLATPELLERVPLRAQRDTKYTAGSVIVVGGSPGLTGAACLAARAAFRADAGYVTVAAPRDSLPVLEQQLLEAVKRPLDDVWDAIDRSRALAIGPGLGRSPEGKALVRRLLVETDLPAVVDADALHELEPISRAGATVLTPHSGELARLLGEEAAWVDAHRLEAARRAVEHFRCVVLLKGDGTIVAAPDAQTVRLSRLPVARDRRYGGRPDRRHRRVPGEGNRCADCRRRRGGRAYRGRGRGPAASRPRRFGRDRDAPVRSRHLAMSRTGTAGGQTRAVAERDGGGPRRGFPPAATHEHAQSATSFRHAFGTPADRSRVRTPAVGFGQVGGRCRACGPSSVGGVHRSELTVDLGAIRRNVSTLLRTLDGAELWAVVKADGYGHGATDVAGAALDAGATALCVATVPEALALRREFAGVRIVVLGPISTSREIAHARDTDVELTVSHDEIPDGVRVHLKLDTGMGRFGMRELPGRAANVVGLMTHFATADNDEAFARAQLERFLAATNDHADVTRHAANSAAALRIPEARLDAVRCGVAVYGLSPFNTDPGDDGLEPALSWQSHLAQVKLLRVGESTGYGRRFVAERDTWIGLVPVGYADGFRRDLTGTTVRVAGEPRRVIGTVSMDSFAVELDRELPVGAPVVLLGHGVLAEEHARVAGTINYEIVCGDQQRSAANAPNRRRWMTV